MRVPRQNTRISGGREVAKQTPERGDLKDKWTTNRNTFCGTDRSQKEAADGVKASIPTARHQQ